jgi:hypothetical protein
MKSLIDYGLYVCLFLFIFSFFMNLINHFDDLKVINQEEEIMTFYELTDTDVKNEKFKKERLIYKYIIYFVFFIDIDHLEKILKY